MSNQKKILVIEDDKNICRTVELYLKMNSFSVMVSHDGKDGLQKAKEEKPDLIILDLRLPRLPGEEICRQLKREENYNKIPIIMLTAKGTDADRVIGKVIGADYYLIKPFDLDALLEKINNLFTQDK